jgi:DNA-binding response OmpR family regulator
MATLPNSEPRQVGLLVLESDPKSGAALKQILDSEGWRVRIVEDVPMLHVELKTAEYSLLIANVSLIGVNSPTFHVLRELGSVSAEEGGKIRTLFVIPEMNGSQFISHLEAARLPYVLRPFHLHDFLEKVSDLLVEVKAIAGPLRMTRYEFGEARKRAERRRCSLRGIPTRIPRRRSPNMKSRSRNRHACGEVRREPTWAIRAIKGQPC